MRWKALLLSAALSSKCADAIFADDAYTVDYHEALLGLPQPHTTFFHKPHASSNASLLYSLSDKAVLGAINPKDGSIVWRQSIFEEPLNVETKCFLVPSEDGRLTAGCGSFLNAYDAADGKLVWNIELGGEVVGLDTVPTAGVNDVQDVVVLAKEGNAYTITRLSGDDSRQVWQQKDSSTSADALVSIAASFKDVYVVSRSSGLLSGGKTKVVKYDIQSGKEVKEYSVNADAESVLPGTRLTSSACPDHPFMITADRPYTSLKFNLLGTSKVSTLTIDAKDETILALAVHAACDNNAAPHFLVNVQGKTKQWAEVFHVDVKSGEVKKAYALPATGEMSSFAASVTGNSVYLTRVSETEVSVYSSKSHGHLGRWARRQLGTASAASSKAVHAAAEVVNRGTDNVAVRVTALSTEGSWYLIRNGDTQWLRPEMLAYTTMATFTDDVIVDPLVQEMQEEISANVATAYINRLYRHATELRHLPAHLLELPLRLFGKTADIAPTSIGLSGLKFVIGITSKNYLYALNANSGKLLWHNDLTTSKSDKAYFKYLACESGRITTYLSDGAVIVANATNGQLIEKKAGSISVSEIIEVPGSPASTVLKIGEDGVPRRATDFAPSIPEEGNVVVTLDKNGVASGWTVGADVQKMWTIQPVAGQKIVGVSARPNHDPVASIGRVLGDRSVLYKYVTPNLALLTALGTASLTVYLIDAVTGATLFTATHQGVLSDAPVAQVLSENWFAYSFTVSDTLTGGVSSQIVISEMYEAASSNDRGPLAAKTNYSSFSADAGSKPHVLSHAYTISEPISSLAVSQSAQGITSRSVLAYLSNSRSIVSIPRHILDARRPMNRAPTNLEAEEGLFQYSPVLDLDPKAVQSHAREVIGIKKILSSPTLLESTSSVFAYGHDVFGTQITPSMAFDVLGKTFNRVQLVLTVVALYLGVLALRPMVRKQMVQRGWL